jgi:hypothetical protein
LVEVGWVERKAKEENKKRRRNVHEGKTMEISTYSDVEATCRLSPEIIY